MKASERRRIVQQREAELSAATAAVLSNPDANIAAELRRIREYDRLLASDTEGPGRERLLAVVIGILCVTIVGLGQVIRMPVSSLKLFVESESTKFEVSSDWSWNASIGEIDRLRLVGFESVELPTAISAGDLEEQPESIGLKGGQLTFEALMVGEGGRVTIDTDTVSTDLFAEAAAVSGQLTMNSATSVDVGSSYVAADPQLDGPISSIPDIPEIVTFAAEPSLAVPVHIRIEGGSRSGIDNVQISELSFARKISSSPGNFEFESTIVSGHLSFPQARKEVVLHRGDHIEIREATEARLVSISLDERLMITFEGKAKVIKMVQAGEPIDLRPTVLEYIFYNNRMTFLWSALGIVWGFAWSIRRTVFG